MGFVTPWWPSVALAAQFSSSATANATFSGPASRAIQVLNLHFIFQATATVGNRLVVVVGRDSAGNTLWRSTLSVLQTASQGMLYSFQSAVSETLNVAGRVTLSLPPFATIPPGGSIKVWDEYSIDNLDSITQLALTYTELV